VVSFEEFIYSKPRRRLKICISICIAFALYSCDFEKEVEVKLPPYEKLLVAECYIERGQPLRMLLLETDPYFDTLRFPFINNANVSLNMYGKTTRIDPLGYLDFPARKFYNYNSAAALDYDTLGSISLAIVDSLGRKLEGQTRFLPIPDFDSIEVKYNNDPDSLASFVMWLNDFPGQSDYYRLIFNEDSLTGSPSLEFTFTDQNLDGKRFPIGTSYRFKPKKTMFIRLFHIEQQYYNYIRSLDAASRANGNPFAQPATIASPMKGKGYGIFTSLNKKQYEIKY